MKKHILIVDDEAEIRNLLAEFLVQRGYDVATAATAAEAEESLVRTPPQLIISDLQLEDSDGLEMISRFKERLPDTPVMLLTGVFFDALVVKETLSKKINTYVQKTAPLTRILEEVTKLIGS